MANAKSGKGNPASKRMTNPTKKLKRQKNKSKNEMLKAKGQHPKQLRNQENQDRATANKLEMAMLGFKNRKQVHAHRAAE